MTQEKRKILVVEDDKALNEALSEKLSREGFEVLAARDGQSGLDISLKEHPDLILLDIIMPKMDGMTMLRKLREDEWGKNAKVIILTNLTNEEKEAECEDSDVNLYLVKSNIKIEQVIERVKEVLG